MSTFTATANTFSTIGYAQYGSTTWNTGSSDGACQGAYQATTSSGSRVGVMVFFGAGAALRGKIISQITLKITCSAAGSSSSSKKLSFREAKYQTLKTGIKGSEQVGDALGTLTGTFYDNTVNATTNAALFEAIRAYLVGGNSALVLYNGETTTSSGYSTNYARVTSCVITVTYMDATVWYFSGTVWTQCVVWYCLGGTWVQCVPWYNSGGTWIRV
ncbi:MAG: hypothetical protein VB065_00485 [Eubacteriales bacterium]|nr:hypothetical protein [Christensenellaceae bacterium]MEA5064498.1 hypothetical protein [Eubacteriales bacterium]